MSTSRDGTCARAAGRGLDGEEHGEQAAPRVADDRRRLERQLADDAIEIVDVRPPRDRRAVVGLRSGRRRADRRSTSSWSRASSSICGSR